MLVQSARRQARLQVLVAGSKLPRNLSCRDGVPKFASADNVCTDKKINMEGCNTRGIICNSYKRVKSQWITKGCYSQNFCRPMRIVCKRGEASTNITLAIE